MTSSMMTGEQRWASKRRSGMTVLGKVAKIAAPKPLNLPSQRLENHGLDPSVEIVPKGTLSWGSRPSSSGSNAWATSALSPSTDGGSSSANHLAGRPVSGGGTRPSTAGSDKAPDSNSWGPNSRPSSASGVLGSNHTSLTSLRPRSADTRPGSSQLSRFAEHSPDSSGAAWGPSASSERMGVGEGFSLTSGDFPTLGSEKDESLRNLEPLDASHGRPGSSSGGGKPMPDSMEIAHDDARDSDIKGHSWRKDGLPFVEGGPRPSMERWHGDPHLYQNPNMGPPHYDSWRGPPSVNHQGGVWYRGPPGPPPYGGPMPPGGFHMEPFPYYPPQAPLPGPTNSQSIPPGAGNHGHHPNNGDMYRPHMPESFIRPGLPMRPGFYPPVHFEGYHHGPPMGFCNPNERDLPFMGMGGGPIYNRPTNHYAPDLNNSHPRSHEGRGPDQVDPDHLHDRRGNYKVLVKQNDAWNQNDEEKWSHRVTTEVSDREKGILSRTTLQENAWGSDYKDRESLGYSQSAARDEVPSRHREDRFRSNNSSHSKISGSVSNVEECNTVPATDIRASSRDHSLMQKIEGLNAKKRASGGNQDGFRKEDLTERVQVVNDWAHQSVDKADTGVDLERHFSTGVLVPVSCDSNVIASERSAESITTPGPRRAMHGPPNRGNHHVKGNFDGQEASRWGRKFQFHSVRSTGPNITTNDKVEDHNSDVRKTTTIEMKVDGESALSGLDPNDTQRAKMREIAKQRAIQLRKEEEERIREQNAKALAKLEELNRRSATQVTEASSQKEIDKSRNQPYLEANSTVGPSSDSSNKIAQINEKNACKAIDSISVDTSRHAGGESKKNEQQESVSSQNEIPTANINVEDAGGNKIAAQVRDVLKHKRAGYKPRHNVPAENNVPPKEVLGNSKGENATQDITASIEIDEGAGKELHETPIVSESSAPQKRRHNKSGKSKHRAEDLSRTVSSTVPLSDKSELGEAISASAGVNNSDLRATADANEPSQLSGNRSSLSREDDHGRGINSWKAQNSRKTKSSQGSRLSEKSQSNDAVVWAPVRSHNKVEVSDLISQKVTEPLASSSGENMPQISPKTKRAEIERYVPKPVAKELAQQGSNHQPSSLSVDRSQTAQASLDSSAESGGREKAFEGTDSVPKAVLIVEGKNRHSKGHGSWRQRSSAESNPAQASKGSMMTEPPNRPREPTIKEPEANLSDGWGSLNDSNSNSSAAYTGIKDQFPQGRGRKHSFKGQKGNYQSAEHKDSNVDLPNPQSGSEVNHTERTQFSRENRAVLDRSASRWQPKSQVNVAHNQQGKWSRGSQSRVPENNRGLKPDVGSGSGVQTQSHYNQSEGKEVKDTSQHEPNREKIDHHVKGRPRPPSRGLEAEAEPILSKAVDGNIEQRPSSGHRKNSNHGGRVNRVHESRGDHYYSSVNEERQRPNSQYEYQAVGSYNESDPQTENQRGGTHFRGRGHSRGGRGTFYGRQSNYQ